MPQNELPHDCIMNENTSKQVSGYIIIHILNAVCRYLILIGNLCIYYGTASNAARWPHVRIRSRVVSDRRSVLQHHQAIYQLVVCACIYLIFMCSDKPKSVPLEPASNVCACLCTRKHTHHNMNLRSQVTAGEATVQKRVQLGARSGVIRSTRADNI